MHVLEAELLENGWDDNSSNQQAFKIKDFTAKENHGFRLSKV